ncbi:MAG: hypothetical protein ACP5NO_08750, partial [Thermoplasmata archaeon]
LDLFVGPNTEAVMISSMDPLGLAYVSSTYNPMIGFGGKAVNRVEFEGLLGSSVPATFNGMRRKVSEYYRTRRFKLIIVNYLCP